MYIKILLILLFPTLIFASNYSIGTKYAENFELDLSKSQQDKKYHELGFHFKSPKFIIANQNISNYFSLLNHYQLDINSNLKDTNLNRLVFGSILEKKIFKQFTTKIILELNYFQETKDSSFPLSNNQTKILKGLTFNKKTDFNRFDLYYLEELLALPRGLESQIFNITYYGFSYSLNIQNKYNLGFDIADFYYQTYEDKRQHYKFWLIDKNLLALQLFADYNFKFISGPAEYVNTFSLNKNFKLNALFNITPQYILTFNSLKANMANSLNILSIFTINKKNTLNCKINYTLETLKDQQIDSLKLELFYHSEL